jgi:serine O-acetyltransferase
VLGGLRQYLNRAPPGELGFIGKYAKAWADVAADHEALRRAAEKYKGMVVPASRLPVDFVQKIGFQMMVAYRMMRFFRTAGLTFIAKLTARAIRHLYGADIHWDADLAPGVILVHGVGLVVAPGTKVGAGCVLFQHVTLGENIHPETREIGVPTLEIDVHVGPGATVLGPITVGARTKITASALVTHSVPPNCLVEVPAPTVRFRSGGLPPEATSSTLAVLLAYLIPLTASATP